MEYSIEQGTQKKFQNSWRLNYACWHHCNFKVKKKTKKQNKTTENKTKEYDGPLQAKLSTTVYDAGFFFKPNSNMAH